MKDSWSKILGIATGETKVDQQENVQEIPIEKIEPNPFQPRKEFDEDRLEELMQSIKTYGLLQPILVRAVEEYDGYQIVAGERRYLALKRLNRAYAPAIVRDLNDSAMAALAMIENLQRENLNFIEEAEGYRRLIYEFGLTQEVLAQRLGRSQSTIANKLRLLKLSPKIKERLSKNELTERHARTLLSLPDEDLQRELIDQIVDENLNVKQTEDRAQILLETEAETGEGEEHDSKRSNAQKGKKKRPIVRDLRIFLNTIRQAVSVIQESGLNPDVEEEDYGDRIEIKITLPKQTQQNRQA